jgi:dTDP-glucose 4,6-dehydratase
MKNKTILVTGGAGFIGSNFIHLLLSKYEHNILNLDLLTYAGNLENLRTVEKKKNYKFIKADISSAKEMNELFAKEKIDWIVNFAAESHVDRSIHDASAFISTNVQGTHILLELVKKHNIEKYLQVSTDEVYGTLGPSGRFTEQTPLAPNSPYSASKAGADLLCRAYFETFKLPILTTRCSNNYGPYQFPEKLIPLMITNALENKKLPIYGDGKQIRDWLHVKDHCLAIDTVLHKGRAGEVYNIGGNNEWQNIDVVKLILKELGRPESLMETVKDRLGHDRRYAIDSSKIQKELGWKPEHTFEKGLKETINWYLDNKEWWTKIKTGEYLKYYEKQYA